MVAFGHIQGFVIWYFLYLTIIPKDEVEAYWVRSHLTNCRMPPVVMGIYVEANEDISFVIDFLTTNGGTIRANRCQNIGYNEISM